jgi:hypothetical protein
MPTPASKPPTTLEVIVRLCELGCTVRRLSDELHLLEDGDDADGKYVVRYIRNPRTDGVWICSEYADDEGLLPHVCACSERPNGLQISGLVPATAYNCLLMWVATPAASTSPRSIV